MAELVSAAVGLPDGAPPGPLADSLAAALGSRQMLLVLDNCEHLIGPVAMLAERLLRAGEGLDRADIAGLLARLVDRSLVVVTAAGAREPRYRLLESVAAYGTERLREAGELDRFQRRHREFYVTLAERARSRLRGHGQRPWLQRLDRESANMHSALQGAIRHQEADLALRLAGATWYWFLRGRLTEARRALESALAADGPGLAACGGGSGPARAFATAWLAGISLLAGGDGDAAAARKAYHDVDDPAGQAEADWFLGFTTSDFGDLSLSEDLTGRALTAFQAAGDRWGSPQPRRARSPGRRPRYRRCAPTSGTRLASRDGLRARRREGHGPGRAGSRRRTARRPGSRPSLPRRSPRHHPRARRSPWHRPDHGRPDPDLVEPGAGQPRTMPSAASEGAGSGRRIIRNELSSPRPPARIGMRRAT